MKNLLFLLLMLAFVSTTKAQSVFYNQPSNGNEAEALPSNTILSPPSFGIYLAEDFTLPEGNNILRTITVFGYQEDELLPTIIQGLDVYIYNNVSGQNIPNGSPEITGSGIYEFLDLNQGSDFTITNPGGENLYNITINLTAANNGQDVILPQGTYWVSVVPQIPFTGSSQTNPEPVWFWNWFRGVDSDSGNSAQILDPSDYLGQGLSSWSPIAITGSSNTSTLAISIEGEIELSTSSFTISDNSLTVYPNPTSGLLNLQYPKNIVIEDISLYDALGKESHVKLNNGSVNIEDFQSGVYFIRATTNLGTVTKKIVKI